MPRLPRTGPFLILALYAVSWLVVESVLCRDMVAYGPCIDVATTMALTTLGFVAAAWISIIIVHGTERIVGRMSSESRMP